MRTVRIHGSVEIARPVEVVFDAAADQRREPSYNPSMRSCRKLTDGPVGRGTVFEAEMATRPRPLRVTSTITHHDRPHVLGTHSEWTGTEVVGGLRFTGMGASRTLMTWDWDLRLHGLARLLTPFMLVAGPRLERRIWTGLKAHLEGEPTA